MAVLKYKKNSAGYSPYMKLQQKANHKFEKINNRQFSHVATEANFLQCKYFTIYKLL